MPNKKIHNNNNYIDNIWALYLIRTKYIYYIDQISLDFSFLISIKITNHASKLRSSKPLREKCEADITSFITCTIQISFRCFDPAILRACDHEQALAVATVWWIGV